MAENLDLRALSAWRPPLTQRTGARPTRAHRWFLGGLRWEFISESPNHEVLNPEKSIKYFEVGDDAVLHRYTDCAIEIALDSDSAD